MFFFKKGKKETEKEEKIKASLVQETGKENPGKKVKVEKKEEETKKEEKIKSKPELESKKLSQDWLKSEGQLAVDVYYTDSEFCIQAPIAGVSTEDLDISVENEMLIIKGERKEPDLAKEKNYFYQECYWGPFSRQIILLEDTDPQRIKASLKKGILTIKVPRVTRIKKKKVSVATEE